jgi:hypothetical protein
VRGIVTWFEQLQPEVQAAWAQAVLSALAIAASVALVAWQQANERRRQRQAEADRRRRHLESAFQLVSAVALVIEKISAATQPGATRPPDGREVTLMKLELECLVDAMRQIDYGARDEYKVIESMLVALSSARAMAEDLVNYYPGTNGVLAGPGRLRVYQAASGLAGPLRSRAGNLKGLVDALR